MFHLFYCRIISLDIQYQAKIFIIKNEKESFNNSNVIYANIIRTEIINI